MGRVEAVPDAEGAPAAAEQAAAEQAAAEQAAAEQAAAEQAAAEQAAAEQAAAEQAAAEQAAAVEVVEGLFLLAQTLDDGRKVRAGEVAKITRAELKKRVAGGMADDTPFNVQYYKDNPA